MSFYTRPSDSNIDQMAHILSEIMNDNAPIGWERYRGFAACLLANKDAQKLMADAANE